MSSFGATLRNVPNKQLVYPDIVGQKQFTNILLIDNSVPSYETFVDSVNPDTFPIVYSVASSKTELLALLQKNFTSISRIGIVLTSNLGNQKLFLDRLPLFTNSETEPYSENVQFILKLIKEFNVKNIDYLACDTLNYSNWVNYYELLTKQTGVIVGASNDKTGNIKYGGDWIMESTSQDVEFVYFTQSIKYYSFLLDNPTWSSGYVLNWGLMTFYDNYMYFPNNSGDTTSAIIKTNLDGTINNNSWATNVQGIYSPDCCIGYNGYLYVANSNPINNTISKISLTNPTTDYTPSWADSTQGLDSPIGLAINGDYLYVANIDDNTNTISKISLTNPTTDYNPSWANSSQGLNYPVGLAINGDYLYVSNLNNTISKISLTNPTTDYNPSWANSTKGLDFPTGLAINGDYLYVSNFSNNTISKISLTNPTTDYNPSWANSTKGLNGPEGLAINGDYLYVSNYNNGTVSQISLQPPPIPCFKSGTKILTDKGYKLIEDLRKGDLVKTLLNDYKPIYMIGKKDIYHPASNKRIKDQLYKCSPTKYPELFEPLIITGCHSILVDAFVSNEQRKKVIQVNGDTYVTDKKYRLPACADERATVYESPGNYTIYHLALENDNYYMNYGIYANGLLVETCSKRYLKELSGMELIHF